MPRKSAVDWKARCIEAREALGKERKAIVALLSEIDTYAKMLDYEIDQQNFGFANNYAAYIIKAIRDSGYIIERGNNNG